MYLFANSQHEGSVAFPLQASDFAKDVDGMFTFIFFVSLFFFVVINVLMVYFVMKYRRKGERLPEKSPSHHMGMELAWTILPSFILVYMFVAGAFGYLKMRTPPEEAKSVERTIDVRAFKYGWQFIYPDGNITTELHLAKDVPVRFRIKASDALHSFYIREFRVKMDCVPGRYTECWVTPRITRTPEECVIVDADGNMTRGDKEPFHLQCAEYCGEGHSQMRTEWKDNGDGTGVWRLPVYVHDCSFEELVKYTKWKDGEYSRWENGKHYYDTLGCSGCHALEDAPQKLGPNFKKDNWGITREFTDGTTAKYDDAYVAESINYSTKKIVKGYPGQMPKFEINDERLTYLLDFIKNPSEDTVKTKVKDLKKDEGPKEEGGGSNEPKSTPEKTEENK